MHYVIRNRLPLLFALVVCAGRAFAEQRSADQLLAQLDRTRLPPRSFVVDLAIADYRQGKKEREGTFRLYSKRTVSGGFDTLAVCLTPAADRNKLLLCKGDRLWFYDPRSARPVPVSPSHFRSHSFVLDLLGAPLAASYSAEAEGEGTTLSLARREIAAQRLRLTSRQRPKGSASMTWWLDVDNNRPLKGEVFAGNGKLLRTVYYTDYRSVLGDQRPMRVVVVNAVEGTVSEVKFSGFTHHDTPEELFDENELPVAVGRLK